MGDYVDGGIDEPGPLPLLPLHFSFGLLGMSSWVLVSGIYAAAGAYADSLPEGYDISVYLTFVQAMSNIVPAVLQTCISLNSPNIMLRYILVNLLAGVVIVLSLSFFWDQTFFISGSDRSGALLLLMFLSGAVNAATNITHYAFVALFEDRCALYYGAGLGFGSSFIGILSLVQSRGLMSVRVYFLLFLVIYIISFFGLWCITRQTNKMMLSSAFTVPLMNDDTSLNSTHGNTRDAEPLQHPRSKIQRSYCCWAASSTAEYEVEKSTEMIMIKRTLFKVFFLSALGYAIVPSTISIVASRFDNSFLVLSLGSTVSSTVDPLLRLLAGMPSLRSLKSENILYSLCLMFSFTFISLVLISPTSSFAQSRDSIILPIVLYIFSLATFNFLSNYFLLKVHSITTSDLSGSKSSSVSGLSTIPGKFSSDAFRWLGCTIQAGMTTGSVFVTSFLLGGILSATDD